MELLQLKYFCDAAETQNFSKTAEKYFVPPSSVSQSIRRLEKELGVPLFERRANHIVLNEEGKIFYNAVTKSGKILSDATRKLSDSTEEVRGEIRLHVFCNRRIVAEAIQPFSRQYPQVSFVVNHGFDSEEDFDLIIADQDFTGKQLAGQPLITEEIALACSQNHPLAQRETVSLNELEQEQFITMQQNGSHYLMTRRFCNRAGFVPKISIQCDDPFYMRKYIELGLCVGFVPLFSWQGQISEALVCKKIPGLLRTTYVYWKEGRYMSKAVETFLGLLVEMTSGYSL